LQRISHKNSGEILRSAKRFFGNLRPQLGLGGSGREHIGLDGKKYTARLKGSDHSLDRLLQKVKVMEHGASCHQVISALFYRIFEDIELSDFEVWCSEVSDITQVDVAGNDVTARCYPA
jgi:hypothetical protein